MLLSKCSGAAASSTLRRGGRSPIPFCTVTGRSLLFLSTRSFTFKPSPIPRSQVVDAPTSTSTSRRDTPAAVSIPSTITAQQFAALAPMVLLQSALQQYTCLAGTRYAQTHEPKVNHTFIRRETFDDFCAKAHVADTQAALDALNAAGVVVALDGGKCVHLRPVQYAEELGVVAALHSQHLPTQRVSSSSSSPLSGAEEGEAKRLADFQLPEAFLVEGVTERIQALEAQEAEMRLRLQPAIARAARWRRSVWGGALLYAGTQLAVIARLTYFDLDWDIMEPISYCLGIGTSLMFYLYYIRFDKEHTYTEFDKHYLPRRVHKYAPADFDWTAYDAICKELADERAMLKRIRAWSKEH